MTSTTGMLDPFVRQWAILLTTYRRDGTPVGTPVNIAVDGDHAYIRTYDRAGKAKRQRHNPNVEWMVDSGEAVNEPAGGRAG